MPCGPLPSSITRTRPENGGSTIARTLPAGGLASIETGMTSGLRFSAAAVAHIQGLIEAGLHGALPRAAEATPETDR